MRRNRFGSNIPWWVVIVALCVAPPVGVLLAIVKLFPTEIARLIRKHLPGLAKILNIETDASSNGSYTVKEPSRTEPLNWETPKTKPKKQKRRNRGYRIAAIVLGVLDFFLCVGVFEEGIDRQDLVGVLLFTAAVALCALLSEFYRRREENGARFLAIIGSKDSVHLQKLADAACCRLSAAKRDLQTLINDGLFGERAYIDESHQCFMRFPEALPDGNAAFYKETNTQKSEPLEGEAADSVGVDDYDAALKRIRELDDAIDDVYVSARILRIERATRHIFEFVADFPEKKNQIRTFMNYYLPTTLKLLESYGRIERVGAAGKNMRETKEKIEKTLELLAEGFETQLDILYGSENVDISSDIEVLEQMMARDGLKENTDFFKP